jgi:mono/diheme cytochrome c family protein
MKKYIIIIISFIFFAALNSRYLNAQYSKGNDYEKGKAIYKNKCQFCHGIMGDGKGPASDPLLGHPEDFTDSKFWKDDVPIKMYKTILNGKQMMPAFDLGPDEIKALTVYITGTFKKTTQENKKGGQ